MFPGEIEHRDTQRKDHVRGPGQLQLRRETSPGTGLPPDPRPVVPTSPRKYLVALGWNSLENSPDTTLAPCSCWQPGSPPPSARDPQAQRGRSHVRGHTQLPKVTVQDSCGLCSPGHHSIMHTLTCGHSPSHRAAEEAATPAPGLRAGVLPRGMCICVQGCCPNPIPPELW